MNLRFDDSSDEDELQNPPINASNTTESMDIDEQEDEILAEFDVILTQQLSSVLHLVQFPTRFTSANKQSTNQALTARIKPRSKLFEMEFPIDSNDPINYDQAQGRHFGNPDDEGNDYGDNDLLKTNTMVSSMLPKACTYMVGVISDDQLHLTPLQGVFQLRPGFGYIDKIHERDKQLNLKLQKDEKIERDGDEEEEGKMIQMQAKVNEGNLTAQQIAARAVKRQLQQEPWSNLVIFDSESEPSNELFHHLFSNSYDNLVNVAQNKNEYLGMIAGGKKESEVIDLVNGFKVKRGLALDCILEMSLDKMLPSLLVNAYVLPFSKIRDLVPTKFKDEEIVVELVNHAWCVQGVWVVKSEYFYAARPLNVRNYLLSVLNQKPTLTSREINQYGKISSEMIKNMFSEICHLVAKSEQESFDNMIIDGDYENQDDFSGGDLMWKLKWDADKEFVKKFSAVIEKQSTLLENLGNFSKSCLQSNTTIKKKSLGVGLASSIKSPKSKPRVKKETAAETASPTSTGDKTTVGEYPPKGKTALDQLDNFIIAIYTKHGVYDWDATLQLCLKRKSEAISSNLMWAPPGISEKMILESMTKKLTELNSLYILKTLNNPTYDKFRTTIVDLFSHNRILKRKDVIEACKTSVGETIPNGVYTKIMKEFSTSKGMNWTFKEFTQ